MLNFFLIKLIKLPCTIQNTIMSACINTMIIRNDKAINMTSHGNSFIKLTPQLKLIFSLIFFAVIMRLTLPPLFSHPANFSPIDATALFCGAYFNRRLMGILIVLVAVGIGDLITNKLLMDQWVLFYPGFYWQYACYFLITLLGSSLVGGVSALKLASTSLCASILFFVISNFGVWCGGFLYPLTWDGLMACYIAAIPFFKNTILSDLLFSVVLFGSYEWLKLHLPSPNTVVSRLNS